jgi:hypothetical protein
MFFAGIRHSDRVRGAGWLDCPNCHEHAAQDVVDEMSFVALLFYRFFPVRRRRVLVCRKCGFRRPATRDQMAGLETSGKPIHRAWLAPIGMSPFIVAAVIAVIVSNASGNAAVVGLSFVQESTVPVAPITFDGPAGWNYNGDNEVDPPQFNVSDPGGRTKLVFRRIVAGGATSDILTAHWKDETGLSSAAYPPTPCPVTEVKIADVTAIRSAATFEQTGDKARSVIFVLVHDKIGYTITYVAFGAGAITDLDPLISRVNSSIKFGAEPKVSPTPTPLPSESPTPAASASPVAGATPSSSTATTATGTTTTESSATPTGTPAPGCAGG